MFVVTNVYWWTLRGGLRQRSPNLLLVVCPPFVQIAPQWVVFFSSRQTENNGTSVLKQMVLLRYSTQSILMNWVESFPIYCWSCVCVHLNRLPSQWVGNSLSSFNPLQKWWEYLDSVTEYLVLLFDLLYSYLIFDSWCVNVHHLKILPSQWLGNSMSVFF